MEILRFDELPHSNNAIEFEGAAHTSTTTPSCSKQVNIHASPRFVTEWLEEEAYGR